MNCDVLVVGAGHAGCEAAAAAARMGREVVILTASLTHVARMPCNPRIGGHAKSHLVREVDALGGHMAEVIDRTHIHIRMLNTSKGPAVHALRAQADRPRYSEAMRQAIFAYPNITLKQDLVEELLVEERDGARKVIGVRGTSGTRLSGPIGGHHHRNLPGWPDPHGRSLLSGRTQRRAAQPLVSRNRSSRTAFRWAASKPEPLPGCTATPSTFRLMEEQAPTGEPLVFPTFPNGTLPERQLSCYLTRTTAETKRVILANLDRSPMYQGIIEGTGPRYCPSIEDKDGALW
jgi:tRNA uridine 5-carboxymethylaminomethyl modification enzyme